MNEDSSAVRLSMWCAACQKVTDHERKKINKRSLLGCKRCGRVRGERNDQNVPNVLGGRR